jgi:hypothetical protein
MPDIIGALEGSLLITLIVSVAIIVFAIIIWWKIFAKAGYSGALGLLMFIPIANLIVLCVLAFGRWPIYQELNDLRQRVRQPQFPPVQQYQQFPPQNPSGPQYPQNPSGPQYPQYRG